MRLDKYLCDLGIGTRSAVKEIIKKKRISVNENIVTDPSIHVDSNDRVKLDGNLLKYQEYRYYMLNKPSGVITATEDKCSQTVLDLLSGENVKDLFPVGRLDKDTEGLLLITNDGNLAHDLLSPKKHVDKCYYVELEKPITKDAIKALGNGVDIGDDTCTLPATISAVSPTSVYITITEGRYHQIKRMFHAVGNHVTYLKRISMGSLTLDDDLPLGNYRPLYDDEILMLQMRSSL